jgi:gluconokinase
MDDRVNNATVRIVVVMGVSGAGKTLIGRALARAIHWPFHDADDYHSPANIQKMQRGEGLTDADRAPWLERLHELTTAAYASGQRMVLACSALKESYRERLRPDGAPRDAVRFVYLDVPRAVLEERLRTRRGHFAPVELLDSQLATLEPPRDALWVDGTAPPDEIVRRIRTELGL